MSVWKGLQQHLHACATLLETLLVLHVSYNSGQQPLSGHPATRHSTHWLIDSIEGSILQLLSAAYLCIVENLQSPSVCSLCTMNVFPSLRTDSNWLRHLLMLMVVPDLGHIQHGTPKSPEAPNLRANFGLSPCKCSDCVWYHTGGCTNQLAVVELGCV